jgi:PPK2 family polyphosphate:nucleotide phosphotransferase
MMNKEVHMDFTHFLVKPGSKVKLDDFNTSGKKYFNDNKESGEKALIKYKEDIDRIQEILYAEHLQRLLIVLQAIDTAGKDGATRAVFDGVNPQGAHVASFKSPTLPEMDHDYLWRIHAETPAKGEIVIFNRSHYEDVLIVRVHNLVPEERWRKRYHHINEFERLLSDEGTTIIKFFLHISKDTQKERLLDRINVPEKNWKFNPGDIEERKLWLDYMNAYEEAISETSTEWAPWYVVPADHNWVRDLIVAGVVAETLKQLDPQYPKPVDNIEQYKAKLV